MSKFRTVTGKDIVYARIGVFGPAGSGKTRTATEVAIGLCKDAGNKPIYFVDTEGVGSDYVAKFAIEAGIEMRACKTRVFSELPNLMNEAEAEGGCLVIDSITHFWLDIQNQFMLDNPRKKSIEIRDWKTIKDRWQADFAYPFVTLQCHSIICGREGDIYVTQRNDRGKLEMIACGKKMKAERDTQYEPSLLLQMAQYEQEDKSLHVAFVRKDRSDTIQGKRIEMPTYGSFAPHFKWLNPSGSHRALDASIQAKRLFSDFDESDAIERKILVDKIRSFLDLKGLSGTSKDAKKEKAEILLEAFGSSSSLEIAEMDIVFLRDGVEKLYGEKNAQTE